MYIFFHKIPYFSASNTVWISKRGPLKPVLNCNFYSKNACVRAGVKGPLKRPKKNQKFYVKSNVYKRGGINKFYDFLTFFVLPSQTGCFLTKIHTFLKKWHFFAIFFRLTCYNRVWAQISSLWVVRPQKISVFKLKNALLNRNK